MKKYRVIYADPPWDYGLMKPRKQKHRGGNPQSHYRTMSLSEVMNLPIGQICEDTSCLFLWVTNPKIQDGLRVMAEWGFRYQTIITWIKITRNGEISRNGLGFYFRGATEHLLFGTRGNFKIPTSKRLPNVILAERGKHSSKPHKTYELIEGITEGKRIELFARQKVEGWDSVGFDIDGCDIKESLDRLITL